MLEKLKGVEIRYRELTEMVTDPAIISDRTRFRELSKEHAELEPVVALYEARGHHDRQAFSSRRIHLAFGYQSTDP